MKDLVMDFPFLLDFIIIGVSQVAKSTLSLSETAEIMGKNTGSPQPRGEICFLSISEDGYFLSMDTPINP